MRHAISTLPQLAAIGYRRIQPPAKLRPYIQWFWEISSGTAVNTREEFLHPNGGLSIVFNWGANLPRATETYDQGVHVTAACAHSEKLTLSGMVECFGILLTPVAVYSLLGKAANQIAQLSDLPAGGIDRLLFLSDTLLACKDFQQRAAAAERWAYQQLSNRCAIPRALIGALNWLEEHRENAPITALSASINLSRRQLERQFLKHIGLTPIRYAGIRRIAEARRLIKHNPEAELAEIALCSGFYDQAHFNKAFRQSMGITPGEYLELHMTAKRARTPTDQSKIVY